MKQLMLVLAAVASLAVPQLGAPGRAQAFSTPDQGAPCSCNCYFIPGPNKYLCFCVCDA